MQVPDADQIGDFDGIEQAGVGAARHSCRLARQCLRRRPRRLASGAGLNFKLQFEECSACWPSDEGLSSRTGYAARKQQLAVYIIEQGLP